MKESTFLKKLEKKSIVELVEPSEEMKSSYLIKAENCLKSAKILFQSQLYENSTSEAYYCMYNSLLSLLFKIGIKSENHSASIILFNKLFENKELVKIISWAKGERIDKQYYIETQQIVKVTKESCNEMITKAEDFLVKMKLLISEISNEKINSVKDDFSKLFE
ncbi:HEPN domain-containing protein [Candidatus Pacearchaeota archaeon]|nr:HEPN domain-containing protein [Candidatus Pacearchaeota archaeon]